MTLSLSGRIRRTLASLLWPPGFVSPPAVTPAYANDGLITMHNSDFLHEPLFQRAYAAGKATRSWGGHDLQWRAYVVCWAALRGRSLDGDYVECGVNRGGYSRMLAEYVDLGALPDKKLHLVDTYCGVPDRFASAEVRELLASTYSECHDDVVRTFAPFPNAVVVRGEVPDVLPAVHAERVCFLSVDMNCVEPSIAAAEHFWPRMSRGAAMVLDDYGFGPFHDQKVAFDTFAARNGTQVLSLPTGQGLLIK